MPSPSLPPPSASSTATTGRHALSITEEQHLAARWHTLDDGQALARLISAHLGLVVHIAREFRHSGPSMDDLIQEGNLGLTIAARRFDPVRETRLCTYATYWIRAFMLDHVVRSHGPVRIGTTRSQRKIFFGMGRARRKLEQGGVTAESWQLARELGVPREEVEQMRPRLGRRDVSLDEPRAAGGSSPGSDDRRKLSLGATLAGDGPTPEELVAGCEEDDRRRAQLLEGLELLDSRERAIIRARYMRGRPATLATLAKKLGLSRERVRQIEERAKARLREHCGGLEPGEAALPSSHRSPSLKRVGKPLRN